MISPYHISVASHSYGLVERPRSNQKNRRGNSPPFCFLERNMFKQSNSTKLNWKWVIEVACDGIQACGTRVFDGGVNSFEQFILLHDIEP